MENKCLLLIYGVLRNFKGKTRGSRGVFLLGLWYLIVIRESGRPEGETFGQRVEDGTPLARLSQSLCRTLLLPGEEDLGLTFRLLPVKLELPVDIPRDSSPV